MSKSTGKKQPKTAKKSRFSVRKHLSPPIIGVLVMIAGFGLFNSQWIMAQALNRMHIQAANQYLDVGTVSAAAAQNTTPTLMIPKINVNAPIITDVATREEMDVRLGLRRGVVHYPDTSMPGESGNVVLFGHSSGAIWQPGKYKTVFTLLDKLQVQDLIMIDYNGNRYIYRVTDTKVVPPTDFSVVQQSKISQLTIITCTPVGTNTNRLVVHAKQIFPYPQDRSNTTDSGSSQKSSGPNKLPE